MLRLLFRQIAIPSTISDAIGELAQVLSTIDAPMVRHQPVVEFHLTTPQSQMLGRTTLCTIAPEPKRVRLELVPHEAN